MAGHHPEDEFSKNLFQVVTLLTQNQLALRQEQQTQRQLMSDQAAATYKALTHAGKATFVHEMRGSFPSGKALAEHLQLSEGHVSRLITQHKARIGKKK